MITMGLTPKQQKRITYKFIVGYDFYVYFHNKNKFSYGFRQDWFDGRKNNIFGIHFSYTSLIYYVLNKIQENWIEIISMKMGKTSLKKGKQIFINKKWERVKFYFYPSNMRVMVWKIMKGKYTTIGIIRWGVLFIYFCSFCVSHSFFFLKNIRALYSEMR